MKTAAKESRSTVKGDTWLEPEAITYPSGGFHRRAYVRVEANPYNPIEIPSGLRIVWCSIPDTYSTIPARLVYRRKRIMGYVYVDTNHDEFRFTPGGKR